MNHIVSMILLVIMAIMGGSTSLYMVVALPAVIIWKFYRKIRFGYKLTD